jgi:hypothetical protein
MTLTIKNCEAHSRHKDAFHVTQDVQFDECTVGSAGRDGFHVLDNASFRKCHVEQAGRDGFHVRDRSEILDDFVRALEHHLNDIRHDFKTEKVEAIETELVQLKGQLHSPEPSQGIVRASLQSLKNISENAAGSALAEGVGPMIDVVLKFWGG